MLNFANSTGVLAIRCPEASFAKGFNKSYVSRDTGRAVPVAVYHKSHLHKIVRLLLGSEFARLVPDANSLIASHLIQFFLQNLDFKAKA